MIGVNIMLETITKDTLFHEYYAQWITVYKEGAIRNVTLNKYNTNPKSYA